MVGGEISCQTRSGDQRCTLFVGRPLQRCRLRGVCQQTLQLRLNSKLRFNSKLRRNSKLRLNSKRPEAGLHRASAPVDCFGSAERRRDVWSKLGTCLNASSFVSRCACASPGPSACAGRSLARCDRRYGFHRLKRRLTRRFPVASVSAGVTARPKLES
jgi:hypothetical protein